MGNILQIRLVCATPNLETARARWPRLCDLARELYRRNSILDGGQGLFLPHWEEGQPMPGVRELAETLQQAALIFPESLAHLPADVTDALTHAVEMLGNALGRWQTADADAALSALVKNLDALEASLAETPSTACLPPPAVIEARAVTWNPALLEKTCPRLCEALHDADREHTPDAPPPPADVARLLDFARQAACPPEIRERLNAPLARAEACRTALNSALRDRDARTADRHSNDMDDILEQLEEAVSYRPARRKGIFRRIFS